MARTTRHYLHRVVDCVGIPRRSRVVVAEIDRSVSGIDYAFVRSTVFRIMHESAYANVHRIFYVSVYCNVYCFAKNL
jgi:hypothetical protein